MPQLVLASGSAYRRQLLEKLGLAFISHSPDIDESPLPGETPERLALRLSLEKARALAGHYPDALIVGSDQVACLDGLLLGKPGSHDPARKQLRAASGRTVTFYTGLCLYNSATGDHQCVCEPCEVVFRPLSEAQIERYLHREQPYDCAGSFKSEGLGIALFTAIRCEDPNTLVGLPLIELVTLLESAGVEVL